MARRLRHLTVNSADGGIAAEGQVALCDSIAVIDQVATAPEHRRRGLGRLVSQHGAAANEASSPAGGPDSAARRSVASSGMSREAAGEEVDDLRPSRPGLRDYVRHAEERVRGRWVLGKRRRRAGVSQALRVAASLVGHGIEGRHDK